MIIYKKNRIVGWINIILGILGCISWFICSSCITIERKVYIDLTSEQYSLAEIFIVLMAVPLVFTFIINLIYIFKNWHNKKSMILNILAIVSIILSIGIAFILESYKYVYIILILVILGILLLIFNKNEEEGKKHIILFGIMVINIILFIISSIGFICIKNDFEIIYANNEKNLIKNIMQESTGTETNIPIIRVKNKGKWGYINSSGKTIIDFDYDDCSDFIEIENIDTNKKYYIAVASIGNELRIITNNNKQIASYKNTKREIKAYYSFILMDLEDNLEDDAKALNTKIEINYLSPDTGYSYDSGEKESKYDSNMNLGEDSEDILEFYTSINNDEFIELIYNTKTESVTYNGRKVSIEGNLYFYTDSEDDLYIDTYKNGNIPIYNFEKEIFGWIDLNGRTHYINGKKQILDFNEKYIAIKDYSIEADARVCIMDYNGEIVSEYYKEINVFDKGFIVKKQNGKNIYLNNNLKQITQEYDIIDACRLNDDILIVSNLKKMKNYSLEDMSFDVINVNNGKVIGKSFEYIDGMSNEKYKANYYDDITDNEFKEILCSVDCEYLNTELYEKYYN